MQLPWKDRLVLLAHASGRVAAAAGLFLLLWPAAELRADRGEPADLAGPDADATRDAALTAGACEAPPVTTAGGRSVRSPLPHRYAFPDSFGDPRSGGRRKHEGVDIPAPKGTPVHAVADGTVRWLRDERGGDCCDVGLVHDDGWRTRYIHLDNDTPGTDDGQGYGIAAGLAMGSRVRAGDVIGWVGDSGNAEACEPHLHFELRHPDGHAVDPSAVVRTAMAALPPPPESPTTVARR